MNPPETSQPPFFQEIFNGLGFTTFVIFFVIFFCKQLRKKNHCFEIEEECFLFSGNRRVNIDQAITKYIIHIQPSLLTSLVLCSNFNLFTCTLYWQFFANFLWECNGWKLDIKWGEMLLVSNSDHKRHLNYNNIVNRICHSSKRGNRRVLKMSIVQMYWKKCFYNLKLRFLIIKCIHKLNHKGALCHPNVVGTKRVSSFSLIFCSQLWKWFVGSTTHQR